MKLFLLLFCFWIYSAKSAFIVSQIGHFSSDGGAGNMKIRKNNGQGVNKDSNGFVYISGYTDQNIFGFNNAGSTDVFMAKYDSSDNLIQGALFGSSGLDVPAGQALSPDESTVYVTGYTSAAWFVNATQGSVCGFLISVQTQNLSSMNWGGEICGSLLQTQLTEVAVDPKDITAVYTCGWTQGNFPAYSLNNHGLVDGVVIKWNATNKNIIWINLVGAPSDDRLWDIIIDNTGVVWTTGWFVASYYDCVLSKFHSNGTIIHQRTYGTPSGEVCNAVVPDNNGGAFLSGGSLAPLNSAGQQVGNATTWLSPFVMHINSNYEIVWLTQLNSSDDVSFNKLKTDTSNTIYVSGWATGDFDGHLNIGQIDLVFAIFHPKGQKIASFLMGTNETDQAFDLHVDSRNVYMVGTTSGSWTAILQPPQDTILIKTGTIPQIPSSSSKETDNTALIAGVVVGGGVLILAGTGALVFFGMKRRKQKMNRPNIEMSMSPQSTSSTTNYRDAWEIDYRKLERGQELGRGAFGVVYLATWRNSSVAVKQLDTNNTNAQTTANFLKEAQNVRNLRPHPNICTILGVCTNPEYPICIVMEYIPFGSLSDMLVEKKIMLDPYMVVQFAKDVASGMGHLHAESILHCDLACRNLLVSARGSEFQIKISDFGLSRMVEATEYVSTTHSFPVRWSAPETLRMGRLSRASDVWSYGITLWEMIEERLPYPNLTNAEVPNELEKGYRLPRPTRQTLPDSFYELLLKCWQEVPSSRPSFEAISKELTVIESQVPKTEVYAEQFSRVSKVYENLYNTLPSNRGSAYESFNNNNNNNNNNIETYNT